MEWDMIGHEWAVNLLAQHVALGRERHAYLFTGPAGIGRRTLALRFAQALNCLEPPMPGQPCGKCSPCKRIALMQHPDLAIVEAEREGEILKIDQVRDLQHTLSLAPYEARYRVAVILRFEEANASAANAMLKTLEEPPARVVVILTAKNVENLLPTIVSRCEVLRLRSLAIDETANGLQAARNVPPDLAQKLAHLSDGRPGYAIRLFETPALLEERKLCLDEFIHILASPQRERFAYAREITENKEELRVKLQVWLTFWRDVLIYAAGIHESTTNLDYVSQIEKLGSRTDFKNAQYQVSAIEHTMLDIDRNINARLALEVLLMDFPRIDVVGE
jgi:DNA polymerase-3 subunit delta'